MYTTDTIPNSTADNQLPTQAKQNVWIININGKEPITYQFELDELNRHQNPRGDPSSRLFYAEGKATREHILKIFAPYLIKSDL